MCDDRAGGRRAGRPEGYHIRVGEGGHTLSGGERQRVSIARVILKDAPIVLLDEATTALDPINGKATQQALATLAAEKTLLVVAPRLATIQPPAGAWPALARPS